MKTNDHVKDLLDNMEEKTSALLATERSKRILDMAAAIQISMPFIIEGNKQPHLTYEQSVQEVGAAYAIVIAQHAVINTPPDKTKLDTLVDLIVRMSEGIQAGGVAQGVPSKLLYDATTQRRREAESSYSSDGKLE